MICKNGPVPHLYFIEVKFHIASNSRLAFGSGKGKGFQPEILLKRPHYFENNLRWVIGTEESDKIYLLSNETLIQFIAGGTVGEKFNNIQKRMFREQEGLTEAAFIDALKKWII